MNEEDINSIPITEFYKDRVIKVKTISKKGGWWSAVVLLKNPQSGSNFINIYRWQLVEDGWKTRKRFTFRTVKEVVAFTNTVKEFAKYLTK